MSILKIKRIYLLLGLSYLLIHHIVFHGMMPFFIYWFVEFGVEISWVNLVPNLIFLTGIIVLMLIWKSKDESETVKRQGLALNFILLLGWMYQTIFQYLTEGDYIDIYALTTLPFIILELVSMNWVWRKR